MTAHQDELVVHEVTLAEGGTLSDEAFLTQGKGSAFESRISELVLIKPDGAAGVVALPDTTENLVSKGFHNLVLSLAGFESIDPDPMQALARVQSYLSNWGGSLRLCDVTETLRVRLASLGVESLSVHDTRDQAVDDYKANMNGEGPEAAAEPAPDESNDWGWGSNDELVEESGVPVAEVFCDGDGLRKLQKDLAKVVNGGKKYVSLRLHFDRRVESKDLDVLTACRDFMAEQGGLLILVSLPADVMRSFRLMEFDREFLIVETGDEADKLHQQHASGGLAEPPKAKAEPPKAAPQLPSTPATPKPAEASVAFESDQGPVLGAEAAAADAETRAELAKAQGVAAQLQERVKALEAQLQAQTELRERAQREAEELSATARREERRVTELEQARDRAVQQAADAEAKSTTVTADVKRLEEELARTRQEVDGNRETLAQAVAHGTKIAELERTLGEKDGQLAERDAEIAKLKSEAKQVVGDLLTKAKKATGRVQELEGGDAEVLRQRCAALTEEKARILTEAEAEIGRLTEEHQLLREELQNAGEMIERLGKELEQA